MGLGQFMNVCLMIVNIIIILEQVSNYSGTLFESRLTVIELRNFICFNLENIIYKYHLYKSVYVLPAYFNRYLDISN